MSKKLLAILVVLVMMTGLLAGCGGDSSEPTGGDGTGEATTAGGEIAILVPNADHGWTGAVLNYAKEKADELKASGYTGKVYAATDAKNQKEQIDDLLGSANPPAGIVILPYDNTMESSMANVAASGIPFVMFDRIIDNPVVQQAVAVNVKGDNEGIGMETAKRFVEKGLKPGEKVYVMIGDTSSVPEMRNAGFLAGLKEAGWSDEQLKTIEFSAATGWSRSTGKQIFIDWINSKTPAQLAEYKFIFTHDDEIGMGILEALSGTEIEQTKKQAFYDAMVSLASSSGLDEMYQVLKGAHANGAYPDIVANFDLFTVTYDPAMIQTAVSDLVNSLGGESVDKEHTISVEVVDSTNASNFKGF